MKGMTLIVKTISSWVKMLVFLFGIYIILFGHITPGGGFAGGVILACSYVLIMLAFGRDYTEENLSLKLASKLDCTGALLFIAIALVGFLYGGLSFFYNFIQQEYFAGKETAFKLVSAGTIPLSNIAIGLKVGASLFLVLLMLSAFRPGDSSEKEN
ncbi:MAG: MnhB domain-containing protein [Planctomycetota bacterium]|jgi:multicomponent Na+:H+ antiporter subunit B